MDVDVVLVVASVASGVSAATRWLQYRDYGRSHAGYLDTVRRMHAESPVSPDVAAALAPVPPGRRAVAGG